ncbi:fructose-bisphosphatase class II family protein [Actinomycetospora chibensis]|uniref:Fructose-1,6-bisphosphatase n=1 Tax=Actinomycetospora chibensis TaxID=663606 RepID=A0ABV9RN49_9PSEU|nr:fructose-bisphosphatase class II [Actinomycetospora chibensis]MDD7926528.1 fructose-bisphosphatase class II [Actinomycetospora chibensis]
MLPSADSPRSSASRAVERAEPDLVLELTRVTEIAALAAGRWIGLGDERSGITAAVAAARSLMGSIPIRGTVVTDEGEDGPFRAGAQVGDGTGPARDLALAPLDGATLAAKGMPDALAVIAATEYGGMFRAPPITDLEVLVVGPDARDVVHLDRPLAENVRAVAAAAQRPISDITVTVLGRVRHEEIVREIRGTGARARPLQGGEIAGALAASHPDSDSDMLVGIGGAHEGVLAAAALACLGGSIQARLWPRDAGARRRALDAGHDVDAVLHTRDLVGGEDILFSATGVTGCADVPGLQYRADRATTHSVAMHSSTGTVLVVEGDHQIGRLHDLLGA